MGLLLNTETNPGNAQWGQGSQIISDNDVWKLPVQVATTTDIALNPPPTTVDGEPVSDGDRIGVFFQTTPADNGIYERIDATTWQRTSDYNETSLVEAGVKVYTQKGTANAKKTFRMVTTGAITVGTTPTSWEEDGGGGGASEDLAATLVIGNVTGGTNIAVTDGDEIHGEDAALGSGDPGGDLVLLPGVAGSAVGTFTVNVAPVALGTRLRVSYPGGARFLTAVTGPRTPGFNDFDRLITPASALAAEIAAAINDPANSWDSFGTSFGFNGIVATPSGSTVIIEAVNGGADTNLWTYFEDGTGSGEITPSVSTPMTGGNNTGINSGSEPGSVAGDERGLDSVDLQRVRSASTQIAGAPRSFVAGGQYNTAGQYDGMVTGIGNIISASGYGSYTPSMGFGANNYMYYGQYGTLMGGSNNAWYQPYSSGYGPSIVWGNNIDIQANNIAQCIISGAGHSWYNYHFTTSLFMGGAGHYTYGYSYVGGAFIWGRNHRIYEFQEGMATGGNHTLYEAVHSCVAGDSHRIGPSQGGSPEGHVSMGARTWNQNEGEWLFAGDHTIAGNSNVGQAQTGQAISSLRTTDATQGTFRPGSSTTERFYLRDNSTVAFRINITARQDAGAAGTVGDTASWVVEGLVKRGVGAASAAVVGAPTGTGTPLFSDAAAATWSIAVDVDTATGILRIRGTGEASKTIDWTAHIFFSEAGTGTAL